MPDAVQREAILKLILRRAQAERMGAYGGVAVAQSLAQVWSRQHSQMIKSRGNSTSG